MAFAPAIAIGATILGTAVSAFGAIAAGQAQSNMYKYQANVARMQADISRQRAEYETQRGEVIAQREGMKERAMLGAFTAETGASGLQVGSGSKGQVAESITRLGEFNQAGVRNEAKQRAYAEELQGWGASNQAKLYDMSASNARTASYFKSAESLLGGVSSVSEKWYKYV